MNGTSPRFLRIIPLIITLVTVLARPAFSEDIKTITKKAMGGDAEAQLNLGVSYANGKGVPKDYKEAVKWFRKAAEQGNASAQYNLGVSYAKGQGVPQDYSLEYFWISLSASRRQGEEYDKTSKERERVAKKLPPEQLMKAQQMTREWEGKHPRK